MLAIVLSKFLQNVLGVNVPLHGLSRPLTGEAKIVAEVRCFCEAEVVTRNLKTINKIKVFDVLTAFEVIENTNDVRAGLVVVKVLKLKLLVECLADMAMFKESLEVFHSEIDVVVETKFLNEVDTVRSNQEKELDHVICITKLKSVFLEEETSDLFVHLAAGKKKIDAAIFAEVSEDLLLLMQGMTTAGRKMKVIKWISRNERFVEREFSSKSTVHSIVISLTDVAIRLDCCEALDFGTQLAG